MYSLKYGTPPIVRRTGGLADSVEPWDPARGQGTGIVFEHYDAPAVAWALAAAAEHFRDRAGWQRLMRNGMAQDFSWEKQGALYLEQYARITAYR
jgi:starch synthase